MASVARRHLDEGPFALLHAVLRTCPRPLRKPVLWLTGRLPASAHALALSAFGRRTETIQEARRLAESDLDAAVNILVLNHEPAIARELVDGRRLTPASEARLLLEEGNLTQAFCVAERGDARLAARIQGELEHLDVTTRLCGNQLSEASGRGPERSVIHLVTTALPEAVSGYTVRTQGIAKAQLDAGWDVEVVTRLGFPADQGHFAAAARVLVDGVPHQRSMPNGPIPLSAAARIDRSIEALERRLRKSPASVIHAHSKHDNAQVGLAVGHSLDIPVIYEVRGMLEETWRARGGNPDSDFYRLSRDAETVCMREASAVVTLSETMRGAIVSRGVPAEQVHVVPNAIDDRDTTDLPSQTESRRKLGLDLDAKIIGTATTFNSYEGLELLLEAAALAGNHTVLLVGAGPMRSALEARAKELRVNAIFTGRLAPEEVRVHVAAMDIFCIPRMDSPLTRLVAPMKPLTALASAVPLLVSDLPPLTEIVNDSGAGWVAPVGDTEAWVRTLDELMNDRPLVREAGMSGYEWVITQRTWRQAAERYERVYAALGTGK